MRFEIEGTRGCLLAVTRARALVHYDLARVMGHSIESQGLTLARILTESPGAR